MYAAHCFLHSCRPIMNRWKFAFELVNGLIHLHEHKIIHGDIKAYTSHLSHPVRPIIWWSSTVSWRLEILDSASPFATGRADKRNAVLPLSMHFSIPEWSCSAPFEQIKASSDYQWSFPADVYSASLLIGYLVTGHHYNARILQLYQQNKSGSQVWLLHVVGIARFVTLWRKIREISWTSLLKLALSKLSWRIFAFLQTPIFR